MTDPRKKTFTLNRLQKNLRRETGRAIADFNMISDGDLVMVCLSGGKDSYVMLDILLNMQKHAPIRFELVAVNLDQKQPGFPEDVLPTYLESIGVRYHVIEKDTYSVVLEKTEPGKTFCGLCSRLRRGNLYSYAEQIGATKIALGHHRNDIMETLFLNMFFGGTLKTMPPKLLSDDKKTHRDSPSGLLQGRRNRQIRGAERIPNHSVQPVWHTGKHAAPGNQENAESLG